MALPSSGQITLNQVNVELGNSGTAQISMNSSAVRGLFGIASGEIEMSDGYGKSNEVILTGNHQQITISNYISSGGTLRFTGDWIWSNSTSTAALIINIPCTFINEGNVIGKGGNGASIASPTARNGDPGGPAINVTSSGVTIQNLSGAYIAGGGGGGGNSHNGGTAQRGGGGGAGGGNGGTSYRGISVGMQTDPAGSGGALNQVGGLGSSSASSTGQGTAGGAGGYGGSFINGGGGGGRILPGTGGVIYAFTNNSGGAAGAAGGNSTDDNSGGGGGGWGAAGGRGFGTGGQGNGGAGGAAVTGTSRTVTNSGTIYGSS